MKFCRLASLIFFFFAFWIGVEMVSAQEEALPSSCIPVDRLGDGWWKERHEANKARIAQGNVDLLLIGDSITHNWDEFGLRVRDYYYGDRRYVNMGFGSDRTQHVLWRLNDAPMEKIHPKAAMVMLGINNLWVWTEEKPNDVALGIKAIVDKLQTLYPDIQILLLFTFVVGERADLPERKAIAESNAVLLDLLRDDPNVTIRDLNYLWLNENNQTTRDLMSDSIHPTEKGYWIWAAEVEPEISKMLGVPAKNPPETK